MREIGGAIRGRTEVLGRFRAELEDRLRWERVSLGKAHTEAVRGIESKAGEFYRGGMEGSEKRAREAARSDGLLLDSYRRPDEFYRLKYSMLEERLEQVREIDGELAYEKMRRAVKSHNGCCPRAAPFGPSPASNADLIDLHFPIAVCAGFRYLLGSPEMPFFSVFSRVFLQP